MKEKQELNELVPLAKELLECKHIVDHMLEDIPNDKSINVIKIIIRNYKNMENEIKEYIMEE